VPLGLSPAVLVGVLAVVFFGGLVKGTTGFGYAIASTAILASVLSPSVAVVVMILPMLAGNLSLVGELDRSDVRDCVARFWPYVAAAIVGTMGGMALLGRLPRAVLALGLGLFTLSYVAVTQDRVVLPGERWVAETCFQTGFVAKTGLGLVSGLVFGASNVGVQVVAYLDSLDLDRGVFVGVLSMIFVGISTMRVVAAWSLGLFGSPSLFGLSLVAVGPGLAGVAAGGRLRTRVSDATVTAAALGLLTVIGLKLTHAGVTGL